MRCSYCGGNIFPNSCARLGNEYYHYGCAIALATKIKRKYEEFLLRRRNVIGVGVGFRHRTGRLVFDEICVCVNVVRKEPVEHLRSADIIPEFLEVACTDVNEVGYIVPIGYYLRRRHRPAFGGVSIGHYRCECAGTLGGLIKIGEKDYVISNNHVMALENKALQGDPILQPGPLDGGTYPRDVIGRLEKFVKIKFGYGDNLVDAALALPLEGGVIGRIYGLGVPNGVIRPTLGMNVVKCGRSTGITEGIITEIDSTVIVRYRSGDARFIDQIKIERGYGRFSLPGDSGSLILSRDRKIIGLLFAGSRDVDVTYANVFENVVRKLESR